MHGLQLDTKLQLSLVEKNDRALKDTEVSVKVLASGICGTDIHIVNGESRVTPPVILGHEFGGLVAETGSKVSSVSAGDLVAVDPNIACHSCDYCREGKPNFCRNLRAIGVDVDGGMSDVCVVPESQVYPMSPDFDTKYLPFIEPLSCVLHGLDKINVAHGERVQIVGAGTIGLMFLMLLKDIAADVRVDDPNHSRSSKAQSLGAKVVTPDQTGYFDVSIECSGTTGGFGSAISKVKRGGRVLVFGVTPRKTPASVEPNEIYAKELTIVGSYVNPNTFSRAVELVNNRKLPLSSLDVKPYRLHDFKEAFDETRSGRYSKVIFNFNEQAAD